MYVAPLFIHIVFIDVCRLPQQYGPLNVSFIDALLSCQTFFSSLTFQAERTHRAGQARIVQKLEQAPATLSAQHAAPERTRPAGTGADATPGRGAGKATG